MSCDDHKGSGLIGSGGLPIPYISDAENGRCAVTTWPIPMVGGFATGTRIALGRSDRSASALVSAANCCSDSALNSVLCLLARAVSVLAASLALTANALQKVCGIGIGSARTRLNCRTASSTEAFISKEKSATI